MNGSDALEAWEQCEYDMLECEDCAFYEDYEKCAECRMIARLRNE